MFPIGTQILMVMSTANKKLSPRHGSIGYVSGIGPTKFLAENSNNGLIATPMSIIFTKYGNESKLRRERRVILNVIPIELHNPKQDTGKNIKKLRNILNKKPSFFKKQAKMDGAICTGVVIPSNRFYNITEYNSVEVESWVQSHLNHYYFNTILPDILRKLNYTQKFISQLQTDHSKLILQEVVEAIRAAATIYSVRNYTNYLITFRRMLKKHWHNQQMGYNEFLNMYVKDLFDEKKSIQKEEMVEKYATDKVQRITASNINKMSVALTMLNHSKGA